MMPPVFANGGLADEIVLHIGRDPWPRHQAVSDRP